MSMFRPAAEIGSSDSDSSPEASDHEVVTKKEAKSETQPVEDGKLPIPEDGGTDDSSTQDLLAADTDGHSNIMTSALLEFYCLTRAADLLNKQHGSRNRYTRESPEVQFLGKKLYSHKSKFLSAHGVLADGIEDDEWGSTRQYYRDNLDALGLSALEGLDTGDTGGKPAITGTGDIVVASKTSRSAAQPTQKSVPGLRVEGHEVGPLDFRGHHGAERGIPALEDFRLDPRRIPRPLLPLTGSSPTSFPLFDVKSTPSNATMSRYAMEFAEIQIVGRGSFGEVYHVKNHIDGQDYAVKKIPLSQRRLEQLQCGNENQLENIMKEIRTLARLEHANVVRYYGAWLEQTNFPRIPFASQDPGELDDEETQDSEANEPSGVNSFGIVFEHSQAEQPSSIGDGSIDRRSATDSTVHSLEKILSRSSEDDVESIPREFSEQTYSQLSTFGASDGDIFTDGFSNDRSQLQLQRRHRNGEAVPAVVLHIQMSLHPIPLSSYLSQQQTNDTHTLLRRHCYHLIPSLKLILSIVSGVDYLHSKGIIHRDLKPANIFLSCAEDRNFTECQMCKARLGACSKFCHPRIGDFGLVADISHMNDSSPGTPVGSTLPKLNRVVGTEFYCPPFFRTNGLPGPEYAGPSSEEYFDYSIDESLDVYALGVILFELVYRIGTKMERQMVLTGLTRGSQRPTPTGLVRERPVFPEDFERKVDRGSTALPSGESVAESLKTCIRGMLELQPHRRWRCCDVQRYLTGLLNISEQSFV